MTSIRASWFCALLTCAQTFRSVWLAVPRVVGWHRCFSDLGAMVYDLQCPICWKLLNGASAYTLEVHQSNSGRCLKWQKHYEAEGRSPERPPPHQSDRAGRSPERECQDADAAGQFSPASSCFSPDSEPGDDRNPEGREVQDVYAMALVSPASSCYGPDSEPRERSASISMSSEIRRQGPRGRRRRDQGDQEHEQNKKQDDRQTNKQYQGARWTPRGQMCRPRTPMDSARAYAHAPSPPPPPSHPDTWERRSRHPRSCGASHKRSSSRNTRRSRSRRDSRSRRRSRIPRGRDDGQRQRCSRMPETDDHARSHGSITVRRSRSLAVAVSPQALSRVPACTPAEMFTATRAAADHAPSVPGDNIREMATSSGTLSFCLCACRPADARAEAVPLGCKRCVCRLCEWTPECYRLAVQGEDRCEHCTWGIDRGEVRNCGHPGNRLPGSAEARPSSPAWGSLWGSWWRTDGTQHLWRRTLARLRGQTGRISDGQLHRTDCGTHHTQPEQKAIREGTFGRAFRAIRASRSCEPG